MSLIGLLKQGAVAGFSTLALLGAQTGLAAQCDYQRVAPGSGQFTLGDYRLDLGEGDDAVAPQAWQGPLAVATAAGARCQADPAVSIIEAPLYGDGKHLLVTTYSGSMRTLYAVELASCKVLWHSKPFAGNVGLDAKGVHLGKQTLKLGADCLPKR